jgi:predicted dehydrogenase
MNPVRTLLGRPLRLAVIGGGSGSFIGAMHRQAARRDDRYEIVAAVLSADADKSRRDALDLGLAPERSYGGSGELFEREAARSDGCEVVAIMTPNDSHYECAMAALDAGLDVICDKPMTNSVAEAEALHRKVLVSGLVFCLTHNYTGYPLVRQARQMIAQGQLGTLRLIQVEYVQGGNADENRPRTTGKWRLDPQRSGPSLVLGDIGSHAHNLVRFVTGLEVAEVAAEAGSIVPGRQAHDYCGALLRFDNGARGSFWVTQAAAGVENSLRIRVSGSRGTLEWLQELPQLLEFKPLGAPAQRLTPNGPATLPLARRSSRIAAGHPEGFAEGFANLYADAAEAIAARRSQTTPDPLALHFPNSFDGLLGLRFIAAALESSGADGRWTRVDMATDLASPPGRSSPAVQP